ncbi:MAG: cytochrome c [Myxococcota bacterium]
MRLVTVLILMAVAGAAAGATFLYSGLADVAATSPHWAVTEWILSSTMERAVERHAEKVQVPGFLDDRARVRGGAAAYQDMCAVCHGAPGVEPEVIAAGLNPRPPDLSERAEEWSAAELFWITKHGIRMTGMPAFGPTHSDEELWEVVALVGRLPRLSRGEYRGLVASHAARESGHSHAAEHASGHSHAPHHP